MGQNTSNESDSYLKLYLKTDSEYNFKFKREPYKLFEWTHYKNLKKRTNLFCYIRII